MCRNQKQNNTSQIQIFRKKRPHDVTNKEGKMRKVTKEKTISEVLYVSNDGKEFPYPSEAKEHEIMMLSRKLKKNTPKNIQLGHTGYVGMFYLAKNKDDLKMISEYFRLKAVDVSALNKVTEFPEWIGAIMNNYNDQVRVAYSLSQLKEKEEKIKEQFLSNFS